MNFSDRFIRVFKALLPSPFSLAVILTAVTALLALLMTSPDPAMGEPHLFQIAIHWNSGLWEYLSFAMQMMLMLVFGHVLALSPLSGIFIRKSLFFCKSPVLAAYVVTLLTVIVSLFNWGLGLIFGAVLARKVGEYATENRLAVNYSLIGAAGYSGLMVWHGGLSGSAPLKVAEEGHNFAHLTNGPVAIDQTLGSWMNISVAIAVIVLLPAAMALLARFAKGDAPEIHPEKETRDVSAAASPAERLDASAIFVKATGIILLLIFFYIYWIRPGSFAVSKINPNTINLFLFAMCLLLHRSVNDFLKAVEKAITGSAGIMIQFPLYAGIMGIMQGSGLIDVFSDFFVNHSNETTFPVYTLFSSGIVNFFVPSGGGQWGVQGAIVLEAANALHVAQPKAIMALCYGDQLTNMMQPFWALPLLGITGLKAGQILPYTLFLMLVGLVIYTGALLIF